MTVLDQNIITASVEKALNNRQSLLDSRTEIDRLNFIARFSSLLNFYDQNNRQVGNWEPFILKDPVILMAAISKTDFKAEHVIYQNICKRLDKMLAQDSQTLSDETAISNNELTSGQHIIADLINQLFDLLIRAFLCIRRWVYFMQLCDEQYPLKTYTLKQIKIEIAPAFWALISLRQNLYSLKIIKGIKPVNHDELKLFDALDELIWKTNKGKKPCWEILDLKYPLKENNNIEFLTAITATGSKIFRFLETIIIHASEAFEQLKIRKGKFPDTVLLRAFTELLKTHQQQLNKITAKHLQFCYKDILKFKEKKAKPDTVFICAELNKKESNFYLPADTILDAGYDAQNNPVLFKNNETISLSPATISKVCTIAAVKGSDDRFSLHKEVIDKPSVIRKDDKGNILTWKTFGGLSPGSSVKLNQAVSFASPILLLLEGERCINITFEFKNPVHKSCLDDVKYYLSTAKAWYRVKRKHKSMPDINNSQISQVSIILKLNAKEPPVEPFKKEAGQKDPDGLASEWPLLKIEFKSHADITIAPVIKNLRIQVAAQGIKTLQLYNDNGGLDSKSPFQPFGQTPDINSSFIIGSNEIFSKPLDSMELKLNWDKLPADFSVYYKEYNQYLAEQAALHTPPPFKKNIVSQIQTGSQNLWKKVKCFSNKKHCPDITPESPPYSNEGFKVNFKMLQDKEWKDIKPSKTVNGQAGTTAIGGDLSYQLFSTDGEQSLTTPTSSAYFVYNNEKKDNPKLLPDPLIQLSPLLFTEKSSSGFIKMSLTAPVHGFGSSVYPELVTWIAIRNAKALNPPKLEEELFDFLDFSEKKAAPQLIEAAKIPFAPKLSGITLHYAASESYTFDKENNNTPIQCFFYSGFQNYCIYNNSALPAPNIFMFDQNNKTQEDGLNGIPLFQSVSNVGYLLLEIDLIIPGSEISLYFELTQSQNQIIANKKVGFHYWRDNAWKTLPLLSDGTKEFTCSGIIKINIPADISNSGILMPGNKNWLAITYNGSAISQIHSVFLSTNCFEAKRIMEAPYYDNEPLIKAGTITGPKNAIPQIAAMVQPFASFGGKASETENKLWKRAANRLSTKDRAVTSGDFYRLIIEQFSNICYVKSVYCKKTKTIFVYVVKSVSHEKEAHAYIPLLDDCTLNTVKDFLIHRASGTSDIVVSNFRFQYLKVITGIKPKSGYEFKVLREQINNLINRYLSPWITENQPNLIIGQAPKNTDMATLLASLNGVENVGALNFKTWCCITEDDDIIDKLPALPFVKLYSEDYLFIPVFEHEITETE